MKPPTVNVLIIGAQKAGTTALAAFLAQHPDICMAPEKEVHLFDAPDYQDTPEFCNARYARAFPNFTGQRWVCEATPIYMYLPQVAERIRRYNPDMRLIMLLREPAGRALSHYKWEISRRTERLPLAVALAMEQIRLWRGRGSLDWYSAARVHSYVDRGFYSRQIEGLLRRFPRDQLLVLRTDELQSRHADTLSRVYEFLDITKPDQLPEAKHIRPTPETGVLDAGPEPTAVIHAVLRRLYRREVARLETLLDWSLDDW